ncbi:MAG: hypothetical protein QME66_04640 [Candidatus Eisenbacteria bacterium]|nr:hypothetical protein [Candidatus Eisenbacteria bacterium]
MNQFKVLTALTLRTGVLGLSPEQADARSHCLKSVGRGRFEIKDPVQFKAGEEIGFDGEISHALAECLEPLGKENDADSENASISPDMEAAAGLRQSAKDKNKGKGKK